MAWLKTLGAIVVLLAALFAVTSTLGTRRKTAVYLDYICVKPHFRSDNDAPVILLHGLTDTKETWNGMYAAITLLLGRKVCVYDARNHGNSGWNDSFAIDDLAQDLKDFMDEMGFQKAALVGHSMGGLTVMKFALNNPGRVERLFVEDITPFPLQPEIKQLVPFMLKVNDDSLTAIPKDADADTALRIVKDYIRNATQAEPSKHLFLTFPLRKDEQGFWKWKMNIAVFRKAVEDLDGWTGKMEGLYEGKTFFAYGGDSPFKVADRADNIRKLFPQAEFTKFPGYDHVVHLDNKDYLDSLIRFLK